MQSLSCFLTLSSLFLGHMAVLQDYLTASYETMYLHGWNLISEKWMPVIYQLGKYSWNVFLYKLYICSSENIILLGGIVYEYEVGSGCGLLKIMQRNTWNHCFGGSYLPFICTQYESGQIDLRNLKRWNTNSTLNKLGLFFFVVLFATVYIFPDYITYFLR